MSTAKLKLTEPPVKWEKSWTINILNQGCFNIPYTFVQGYNPGPKEIIVDTWILDQKGIKYKV